MARSSVSDECATGFSSPAAEHFRSVKRIIKNIMMTEVIKYLRDVAQTCTRLAHACPDSPTSHGLEEVVMDLMTKAQEFEQLYPK